MGREGSAVKGPGLVCCGLMEYPCYLGLSLSSTESLDDITRLPFIPETQGMGLTLSWTTKAYSSLLNELPRNQWDGKLPPGYLCSRDSSRISDLLTNGQHPQKVGALLEILALSELGRGSHVLTPGCTGPCLKPSQPAPVLPRRASRITDTYFERVLAGGRLPRRRPCVCQPPWAAAARSATEGMWKHQWIRHLQGVT